jgi:hypothetical protein
MDYSISQHEALQDVMVSAKSYSVRKEKKSLWSAFILWATNEDKEHHIGWVGITITSMAAVFFPITMSVIMFNGAHFGMIIAGMMPLALVVTTNLAALPTRYTIPFFFLGILVDAGVIAASFFL